jgi:predicted nucleic acid-binding Zn ribbon protein
MLFDVCGEAVCPTCGARYRRTLNVIALVDASTA